MVGFTSREVKGPAEILHVALILGVGNRVFTNVKSIQKADQAVPIACFLRQVRLGGFGPGLVGWQAVFLSQGCRQLRPAERRTGVVEGQVSLPRKGHNRLFLFRPAVGRG